jgi:Cu/Ag efflux protein CusF
MVQTPLLVRALVVATTAAAALAWSTISATAARAQASRYAAEIATIELPEKRVTLKASMGQQTLRVGPRVVLAALKPGDKVLVTFGQEGTEAIITNIEVVRP